MHVAVRVVALLLVAVATNTVVSRVSGPTVGANIGAGVAAFLAIALVALLWAALDARATTDSRQPLAIRWGIIALLVGVLTVVIGTLVGGALSGRGPAWGVALSDLWTTGPFVGAVVLFPALLGLGIGQFGRRVDNGY